ncbi:hypothetical protein [Mucilaginibacter sp. 10B2]|uniref:hypothetical protein n=1 Tax=Mucilaginibacter sp. 10B2 TaxID=3048574 RepID=UPI002B22E13A|nr:hypothetical protein [Mucilaginibacter sp. 10B2]MEB0277189.1 hypothetical protein [Mucilaginibacter sp. 10B2]
MNVTGLEFFDELSEYHNQQNSISDKYPKMRSILERACKDITANENIQFSNFFSRLNYVCEKTKLDRRQTFQINTLRVNANKVLHSEFYPTNEDYLQDLKALYYTLGHFYGVPIPSNILNLLPKIDDLKPTYRHRKKHDRIRVEVTNKDTEYIYAYDEENPTEVPIKIKHHINGINEEFNSTIPKLWNGCQVNLLGVTIDENGTYFSDHIPIICEI